MSDRGIPDLPGAPAQRPGVPENLQSLIFEKFDGLNTKPLRPGIMDGELSWCDGFMPLGPSNLRTLYGIGAILYTAPAGLSIIWHQGCNLGDTPGHAVLLSDGSLQFVNDVTGAVSQIMPAGTIQSPTTILGFSQWATPTPMLLFAKDQTNGYWTWDGTNLFGSGGVSPEVSITNAGSTYTGPPVIRAFTTGGGVNATFAGVINAGALDQITVINPGTGFGADDFVVLQITGGGSDDSASATATLSGQTIGGVDQVIVAQGGSSYTGATKIEASGGGGSGASFSPSIVNGVITSVAVINPGTNFTSPPTIAANDPGFPSNKIPGGSGFSASCTIAGGQVTGITITYGGTNYITPPTITIVGDGSGAQLEAVITGGAVTGALVKNYGSGYTKGLVQFSGGNNGASATVSVFPQGVSGTTIEVFNNQVWIGNGGATATFPPKNRVIFTTPGSAVNTDPTAGGGAFQSNNAQLRVGYHSLKQVNGFLYLIGDSALDQISGVQASTSGGVTTSLFSVIGIDPQVGTPWPSSVQAFTRDLVFGNSQGIFVSYGGAITKISEPLDGFYFQGPIYGSTANFSSAVAQIFGRYVYMLLLPIIDPFTGQSVNKLLMWDGKRWWTSNQDTTLTYVSTQEINSLLTAWGTDGRSLFPLFTRPSNGFNKIAQSKLWATPGYDTVKMAMSLQGIVNFYNVDQAVTVSIDSERGINSTTPLLVAPGLTWTNNLGQPIVWNLTWGGPGLSIFGPAPVGQQGRLSGMTVQTTASDVALLSLRLHDQVTSPMM